MSHSYTCFVDEFTGGIRRLLINITITTIISVVMSTRYNQLVDRLNIESLYPKSDRESTIWLEVEQKNFREQSLLQLESHLPSHHSASFAILMVASLWASNTLKIKKLARENFKVLLTGSLESKLWTTLSVNWQTGGQLSLLVFPTWKAKTSLAILW